MSIVCPVQGEVHSAFGCVCACVCLSVFEACQHRDEAFGGVWKSLCFNKCNLQWYTAPAVLNFGCKRVTRGVTRPSAPSLPSPSAAARASHAWGSSRGFRNRIIAIADQLLQLYPCNLSHFDVPTGLFTFEGTLRLAPDVAYPSRSHADPGQLDRRESTYLSIHQSEERQNE